MAWQALSGVTQRTNENAERRISSKPWTLQGEPAEHLSIHIWNSHRPDFQQWRRILSPSIFFSATLRFDIDRSPLRSIHTEPPLITARLESQ